MVKVLTISNEYDSAEKLGYESNTYFGGTVEDYDEHIIIRWGNGGYSENKLGQHCDFKHVLNPQAAIGLNCQKHLALKKLAEVVKTPTLYETNVPAGELVVVRPIEHAAGYGFEVKKGPIRLNTGSEYATRFIDTKTEFRVWFANDHTLCAKRITKKKVDKYPCRSTWGYKFCETSARLHRYTLLAASAIGLDTGAADVLYYRNNYYFLELNSAPTIDAKKIKLFFLKHIPFLLNKKFGDLKQSLDRL